MFHLWLFSFVDGLILPFELFKIILYFWPLCGFIFSRLKEPKYLVHTEENCKLSKFDLELVGNCRSTNCRAGTTQKQNSMIYLIVVIISISAAPHNHQWILPRRGQCRVDWNWLKIKSPDWLQPTQAAVRGGLLHSSVFRYRLQQRNPN